jgi:hypothetical protein
MATMASLRGLDDVPWSELTHAYGSASDVPGHIRSLLSPDASKRADAFRELFASICHQGTVYEATVHALPFLIELLRDTTISDRDTLALLVARIAAGGGNNEATWSAEIINPFTRKPVPKPPDLKKRIARERRIVREVRNRASSALDLLLPYLRHNEAELRMTVAKAMASYPAQGIALIPALENALAHEMSDDVREVMESSLAVLRRQRPS